MGVGATDDRGSEAVAMAAPLHDREAAGNDELAPLEALPAVVLRSRGGGGGIANKSRTACVPGSGMYSGVGMTP